MCGASLVLRPYSKLLDLTVEAGSPLLPHGSKWPPLFGACGLANDSATV
jgi:hypothetical protein